MKYIAITQNQMAIVDNDDFDKLLAYRWCAHKCPTGLWRIMRRSEGPTEQSHIVYMHRQIMGLAKGDPRLVDHINGNGLDNRKSNLRIADKSTNGMNRPAPRSNTSGLKGVSWSAERGKWVAQIQVAGKRKALGRFATKDEAHLAYCAAAQKLHGEFARVK